MSTLTVGGSSCLDEDEFQDAVAKASRNGGFDSSEELDETIRRMDNLDTDYRKKAIRFIVKTDTEGLEAFSDRSND